MGAHKEVELGELEGHQGCYFRQQSGGSGQRPQSDPEGDGLPYFTFGVRRGRKRQAAPVFAVVKVMESNDHQHGSEAP